MRGLDPIYFETLLDYAEVLSLWTGIVGGRFKRRVHRILQSYLGFTGETKTTQYMELNICCRRYFLIYPLTVLAQRTAPR